jgi:hypothetical protein
MNSYIICKFFFSIQTLYIVTSNLTKFYVQIWKILNMCKTELLFIISSKLWICVFIFAFFYITPNDQFSTEDRSRLGDTVLIWEVSSFYCNRKTCYPSWEFSYTTTDPNVGIFSEIRLNLLPSTPFEIYYSPIILSFELIIESVFK